jgi:hypothetical protein
MSSFNRADPNQIILDNLLLEWENRVRSLGYLPEHCQVVVSAPFLLSGNAVVHCRIYEPDEFKRVGYKLTLATLSVAWRELNELKSEPNVQLTVLPEQAEGIPYRMRVKHPELMLEANLVQD